MIGGPTDPGRGDYAAQPPHKPARAPKELDEKVEAVAAQKKRERDEKPPEIESGTKVIKYTLSNMSMEELFALGPLDGVFDEICVRHPTLLAGGASIEKAKQNYTAELKRGQEALLEALRGHPEFYSCTTLQQALEKQDLVQSFTQIILKNTTGLPMRVPAEIEQFTSLQDLFAADCHVTELPREIGNCRNLNVLDVKRNQLTRLPDSLGLCRSLQRLEAGANKLTALPNLSACVELRYLECGDNALKVLPPWIGACRALVSLRINNNCIKELPKELGLCKDLNSLHASTNYISEIPPQIGGCSKLCFLYLANNRLRQLPQELGNCKNLEALTLNYNQLQSLPSTIGACSRLWFLHVRDNDLTSLPEELSNCPLLKDLDVSGNKVVKLHDKIQPTLQLLMVSFKNLSPQYLVFLMSKIKHIDNNPA